MEDLLLKSKYKQPANRSSCKTNQNREFGNVEDVDDEQHKSQSSDLGNGLISLAYVSSRGFFFQ